MSIRTKESILQKLNINALNEMQLATDRAIKTLKDTVLLSPTGSGKTLAFLLPLVDKLSTSKNGVQTIVIVPSRELGIQIEQVARELGTGYKINCVYGGRPIAKDRVELAQSPSILIGTPGRIADHLRRGTVDTEELHTLILDEFDKSLEIGFEDEMQEILMYTAHAEQKILTSATQEIQIPEFMSLDDPIQLNFLHLKKKGLTLKTVISPEKDKLETLVKLLGNIGNQSGIIFCNFKDTINRVSNFLDDYSISHGCFYGGLEQKERERALIKFRNGTHQILIATDLAARGLDIPEIQFLIHYQLPLKVEEFTHRNGRTARMHAEGTAYLIKWENEELPEFIEGDTLFELQENQSKLEKSKWQTLFISGGRKDKISKGDIAGLFFKKGGINKEQLGVIELKQDCAFVSVKVKKLNPLLALVSEQRLKKKKVRVYKI